MSIFGSHYAKAYDAIYSQKDYAGEAKRILSLALEHGLTVGDSILDYGCGTGRHGSELAKLGYEVTLTDKSDDMLSIASTRRGPGLDVVADHSLLEGAKTFDLVYSVFDVLSYQIDFGDALDFVKTLASLVRPGGLVLFDAWHRPGLEMDPPVNRRASFIDPQTGDEWERVSEVYVDWLHAVTTINYALWNCTSVEMVPERETHVMKAFTCLELELMARLAGLRTMSFRAAPAYARSIEANDWHVAVLCRREH